MPHGGAGVDAGDVIGRIDFVGHRVGAALGIGIAVVRIDGFVVAVLLAQLHIGRVDLLELFRLHFDIVVPSPVHGHRLVDQEGVVERVDEEFLRGGKSPALWRPVVSRDPGLGNEPKDPGPGVLICQGGQEISAVRALEEQVRRDDVGEVASVAHSQSAKGDEQRDGRRHGQIDGQSETDQLDPDLAGKFAGQETSQSCSGLDAENVGRRVWQCDQSFGLRHRSGGTGDCAGHASPLIGQLDLGHVVRMLMEGDVKVVEQMIHRSDNDPVDAQHGNEEKEDLPDGQEHVAEISDGFHVLLDASQIFDDNWNK